MYGRWIVTISAIIFGAAIMQIYDVWEMMWNSDKSKISVFIIFLFLSTSVYIGWNAFRGKIVERVAIPDFVARRLPALGMAGTLVGFMLVFQSDLFKHMKSDDIENVVGVLLRGMGTAMWTTLVGIVCSMLIRTQVFVATYER